MVKTIYKAVIYDHSMLGSMGADTPEIWHVLCATRKQAEEIATKWIKKTYPKYYEQYGKDLKKHWGDLGAIGVSIFAEKLYIVKKKYKSINYSGKNCL